MLSQRIRVDLPYDSPYELLIASVHERAKASPTGQVRWVTRLFERIQKHYYWGSRAASFAWTSELRCATRGFSVSESSLLK